MDSKTQSTTIKNPLSSAVRAQERISYVREDDVNSYPTESYFQQQTHKPIFSNFLPRPRLLNLQIDPPNEILSEKHQQNVAYVKPITRPLVSPIEGPTKFQTGQDEFLIFGTSRRLRSEFYDEFSKEEELRLREQRIAEREAQLQRQIEEEEERRRIEHMGRFEEAAYIDDVEDEYDEEIIEDTITTRRKPQVQVEPIPPNYQFPLSTKMTNSVGVGDSDVNQYFLLDTGSRSVNPADFPPVYWERLSRYFTEEMRRKRPACRDVALQLTPKNRTISQAVYDKEPRHLRNFGVCVKPTTSTCGVITEPSYSPDKRNSACMTDDLDEYFARLLRSICTEYPNADRTFIKSLYRYSRTDISLFIRRLVERLEQLKQAEVKAVVSAPASVTMRPSRPQQFSVGLDMRPLMFDKRTSSEPPRRNLSTNTDLIICRSQGVSHSTTPTKDLPKTDFGGSTDCFIKHMETGSQVSMTEPRVLSPPISTSHSATTAEARSRKVTTYRIKRISGHVDKEGKVSSTTYETSGEGKPPPSALVESLGFVVKDSSKSQDTVPTQSISTSSNPKYYMSDNVMVETWFEKDISKRQVSPMSRSASPKTTTSPTLFGNRSQPGFSRTIEVARSPTFTPVEDSDSTSFIQHQQFRRTPVSRSLSPGIGAPMHRVHSPNIPLRNYSYKVSTEMRRAVEALSAFYLSSPGGTLTDDLQEYLETVRESWFEMVSQTNIDLEQIEDMFAFLYNSSPYLLYVFVRMPTSRGSTCLHYTVGHGAWNVVSLILNTGYADANRKNAFGFSPIMIAAISDLASKSIDASAMPVLERLFAAGDVNARAGTAPAQTPLMLAARKANTTVVGLLLRQGADVNAQDEIGNTALMCATDCGNVEMVKLLVSRPEINMDLKDQEGSTALSIAEAGGNEEIIKIIRERLQIYKSDLTYHISGTRRQLFQPRTFHIMSDGGETGETLTAAETTGSTTVATSATSANTTTAHYIVQKD